MFQSKKEFFAQDVRTFSLEEMIRLINNVNLDKDIVVIDNWVATNSFSQTPMRVDGLLIILCTSGRGRLGIDLREYDITPDTLVIIQPNNYIHLYEYQPDTQAYILACSPKILKEIRPRLTDMLPLLLRQRTEPVTHLSLEEASTIRDSFRFITTKLAVGSPQFLHSKMVCLLQATLIELIDILDMKKESATANGSRKEELMAKFILAVGEEFRQHREVSYYAQKLCITPKHLTSVSKVVSGRTAGEWIENFVTMEAKVLLKTTNLTIQEISVLLNFANQSFFGKYFKHQTGMTPSDFRRKVSND